MSGGGVTPRLLTEASPASFSSSRTSERCNVAAIYSLVGTVAASPADLDAAAVGTFKAHAPGFISGLVIGPPVDWSASSPPRPIAHAASLPGVVITDGTDKVILVMLRLAIASTKLGSCLHPVSIRSAVFSCTAGKHSHADLNCCEHCCSGEAWSEHAMVSKSKVCPSAGRLSGRGSCG